MRPLDFVRTPKGAVALVTETDPEGHTAAISFLGGGNPKGEKNAWWHRDELVVLDSLPRLLAGATLHPFGSGKEAVNRVFPIKEPS